MKSKILNLLLMLLPFTQISAYYDEDEGETVDQFMVTMGGTGFVLFKAIDMAKEEGYRYVKILSGEYTIGNQSGSFTCQLEDEDDVGEIFAYEDETFCLSISCHNYLPEDNDYIDTEAYEGLSDFFGDDDEEEEMDDDFFSFDDEDDLL